MKPEPRMELFTRYYLIRTTAHFRKCDNLICSFCGVMIDGGI
jgi:hypothetical protein